MAKHTDNPENEGENLNEGNNGDDNFGLPDLDYKPLDSNEESAATATSSYESEESVIESSQSEQSYSYTPEEEPKSNAPIIIAIIIALVLLVAGFLIYQYVYKPKAEKAKKEQLAKQEADKKRKDEEARLAKEKEEAERKRLEGEKTQVVETPSAGTIETLSERTGRYYVVISSDIDDDLIMDFAKKIIKEGTSVSIIPPFGKKKFYRLATGKFDTFADAQANADQLKSKYGDDIWVIKY